MSKLDNKEFIIEAIDNYDLYSRNQKTVLKALVKIAINYIAEIGTKKLSELLEMSYQNTFIILRRLVADGFIEKIKTPDKKYNSYKLIKEKFNYLIKLHENRKTIMNINEYK